ncbi:hypothetical protein NLI96_g8341 [Meripilus lineatus]|uniref:Uncharacterized protein n=1 Tax=Meripilus lineatus TaxID=2056292 RepID=A0AAD5YE23_9APHY|nr:hypothetical protein NLI96_g8341 [Physisporinus lineatus]
MLFGIEVGELLFSLLQSDMVFHLMGWHFDPFYIVPSSVAGEVLMVALTLMKTLKSRKLSISLRRQLSTLFLQNGLVYFVVLTSIDLLPIVQVPYWTGETLTIDDNIPTAVMHFIDTISAILITRFILSLRSHDLPSSNVPGELLSQTDQSAWSSRLIFDKIKSIDIVGNLGEDLDHDDENEDGILADENDESPELRNGAQHESVESLELEAA